MSGQTEQPAKGGSDTPGQSADPTMSDTAPTAGVNKPPQELDLDTTVPQKVELSSETPPGGISSVPYVPDRDRERVRGDLAKRLLWLLTGTIVSVLAFVLVILFQSVPANEKPVIGHQELVMIANALLSPIIGLVGAVIGFYFGSGSLKQGTGP